MSTSPDATPPGSAKPDSGKPSKPSAAGRYLFLFLLGLAVGALAVVMIMRSIDAGKTWQDHYPYATMHLMQAHIAQLSASADANRCNATDTLPHLQTLRTVANGIEPAFGDLREDRRFAKHASMLRARLDDALAAPPLSCAGVVATIDNIGEACSACHQDFRN